MSDQPHRLKPRTIAAQALGTIDPATRAVALPVHVSTTYIRDPDNQYRTGYIYGRPDNATVRQTEAVIAALESAHEALLFGYKVDLVDFADLAAVRAAMKPDTKLVWIETPGNPLWNITDIAAVAEIAHAGGAALGVDSTVATPVFTRPLALGADIVMHSATKYLNGHSDVVAGALAAAREDALWTRIKQVRGH